MNPNFKKNLVRFGFCFLAIVFYGCKKPIQPELLREDKFTLNYGAFENELNLFNLDSSYTRANTQIYMQNGLFYIANSGGQKILKTSSYGDLLTIYYNPETNMQPSFLQESESDSQTKPSTIKAIEYPFNHPSYLQVTNKKKLFVVDTLSDEKIEFDHEENLALRYIILHFDEQGDFVNHVGQEGLGGTPYPTIEGIHSNSANDLIVTCKTQAGVTIFWYNEKLEPIYKIPIFSDAVPNPYSASVNVFSSIDRVIPSFNKNLIFVKIDYYTEKTDTETGANLGLDYDKSCIYFLNINTGKYEDKIDIEPYEGKEILQGEETEFKKVYELLGITKKGWAYLYTPMQGGYALLLLDLKSQQKHKKKITVDPDEMFYNNFTLSDDGILSAILAKEESATICWWRVDKIIGEK